MIPLSLSLILLVSFIEASYCTLESRWLSLGAMSDNTIWQSLHTQVNAEKIWSRSHDHDQHTDSVSTRQEVKTKPKTKSYIGRIFDLTRNQRRLADVHVRDDSYMHHIPRYSLTTTFCIEEMTDPCGQRLHLDDAVVMAKMLGLAGRQRPSGTCEANSSPGMGAFRET